VQLVLWLWRRKIALKVKRISQAECDIAVAPLTLSGSTLEPSHFEVRSFSAGHLRQPRHQLLSFISVWLRFSPSDRELHKILIMDGRSNTSGAAGRVPRSLARVHPPFESLQPVLAQELIHLDALADLPRRQISASARTGPHGRYRIRKFPLLGQGLSRTLVHTRWYVQNVHIPFDASTQSSPRERGSLQSL